MTEGGSGLGSGLHSEPEDRRTTRLEDVVRGIVAASLYPDEQAALAAAGAPRRNDGVAAAERLVATWERRLNAADRPGTQTSTFARRLKALGFDRQRAVEYLVPVQLPQDYPLPPWAQLLVQVLGTDDEAQRAGGDGDVSVSIPGRGAASGYRPRWPHFLGPFVDAAVDRIPARLKALGEPGMLQPFRAWLLDRLSAVASRTVVYEMRQASERGELVGETSEVRYEYFQRHVIGKPAGRRALLLKYPVLARLLAEMTLLSADTVAELLERFGHDRADIEQTFFAGEALGPMVAIQLGLADVHNRQRSVAGLEFAHGRRLIYKPRDPGPDLSYWQVIQLFNDTRPDHLPPLRAARVLARAGYGWFECIEETPCVDEASVARYYFRQGMHTALMYFLAGQDFHEENFIASGEFPVPVDLEGLAAPSFAQELVPWQAMLDRLPPPWRPVVDGPLISGLAPSWRAARTSRRLYVSSGITGTLDRPFPFAVTVWEDPGTDRMRRTTAEKVRVAHQCRPLLHGSRVPAAPYIEQILAGFQGLYRWAMAQRAAGRDLADLFAPVTPRCVVRDTQTYQMLLEWSTSPDLLTSGAAYDLAFEVLLLQSLALPAAPPGWVEAEKEALRRRDIPRFVAAANGDLVSDTGRRFPGAVAERGVDRMRRYWQRASLEELEWATATLRASLSVALEPGQGQRPGGRPPRAPEQDATAQLVAAARRIGFALERQVIAGPWGATWLRLHPGPKQVVVPATAAGDLQHGTAGIAVFLGSLAAVTGDHRWAALAREALRYAETFWRQVGATPMPGAFSGAAGLIYALTAVGAVLQDASLLDRAQQWALAGLDATGLQKGTLPPVAGDFTEGWAGTLAVLLTLYRHRPDPRLLQRAEAIGAALLQAFAAHRASGPGHDGPDPVETRNPFQVPGMAHGLAGIAYAVGALYTATGDDRWLEAVAAMGQAETVARQRLAGRNTMTGWCWGPAGVGLSRMSLLGSPLDGPARAHVQAAAAATMNWIGTDAGGHHLCCGEAGRILFLLEAGRVLDQPAWTQAAQAAGLRLVDILDETGRWHQHFFEEGLIVPELMSGMTGIGLVLLSLAAPGTVPCVLSLR